MYNGTSLLKSPLKQDKSDLIREVTLLIGIIPCIYTEQISRIRRVTLIARWLYYQSHIKLKVVCININI